jgi:hypothetical protein
MAETITGLAGLQRRIAAVQKGGGTPTMKLIGQIVVGQMKLNIPRKTGNTGRSFHVASLTETSARVTGNNVALYIEEGTGLFGPKHRRITPKAAKALRWAAGPAGSLRLSGAIRKGNPGGAGYVFARSTKGMEARPYVQKSVKQAAQKVGVKLKATVIDAWNGAA